MMIDLLLFNANVMTMNPRQPMAESVAVWRGRIVAVGTNAELEGLRPLANRVINLDGTTLMPGFIDAHTHFLMGSQTLDRVRLAGINTLPEWLERVRGKAEQIPEGNWIVGRGWDETKRTDVAELPTKGDLDSIAPDHPVYLQRADAHVGWANSLALRMAGIDRDREDPYGGRIVRDENGEPTGILQETAKKIVEDILPGETPESRSKSLRKGLAEAARLGITGIHDNASAEDIALFQDFRERGELTLRVNTLVRGWEVPQPFLEPMIATGARTGFGDDWIKFGALKISLDGTLGSRTAAMLEPYSDDPENTGVFRISHEELDPIVEQAHRHNVQIALHAIGDAACQMALDSIERAIKAHPRVDHRHRIEHEQAITPRDLQRFAELQVITSLQPCHAITDLAWVEDRVGPERLSTAYAWKSFVESGAPICLGTDWPVETLDPRVGLYASVTRQDLNGTPPGGVNPSEALTIEQALKGYTLDAAWAEFAENRKGSIEPGKYADFVLVEQDPRQVEPRALLDLEVLATIVEGKPVYARPSIQWADLEIGAG
jgi:predicted amidohydrolase YtcJ